MGKKRPKFKNFLGPFLLFPRGRRRLKVSFRSPSKPLPNSIQAPSRLLPGSFGALRLALSLGPERLIKIFGINSKIEISKFQNLGGFKRITTPFFGLRGAYLNFLKKVLLSFF
jgi:hypothetical protein